MVADHHKKDIIYKSIPKGCVKIEFLSDKESIILYYLLVYIGLYKDPRGCTNVECKAINKNSIFCAQTKSFSNYYFYHGIRADFLRPQHSS